MFRNYLSAALRNLARNKLYAAINIIGLSVGFAAAICIALFVRHETTFDNFIAGHENIYRVSMSLNLPGLPLIETEDLRNWIPMQMRLDFPQIEALARLSSAPGEAVSLRHGAVEANASGFYWADPNIFEVLPLPAFAGDLHTALDRPDGIVLTRRMARKYFGRDDPIGEPIEIDRARTMRVTAILEDLPSNSHLNTEILASGKAVSGPNDVFGAGGARVYAYLRFKSGTVIEDMRHELVDFVDRNSPKPASGKASDTFSLPLRRITDIHLHSSGTFPMTPSGDPRIVRSIAIVGVLILLLAGTNFVSLMTARGTRRATEVGVRKVCGGNRRDLVVQFIGESILYAALAMLVATVLVELLLPQLNSFLDRRMVFDYWHLPTVGILAAMVLVIGVLAGIYPALVIASFRPTGVLKSASLPIAGNGKVRQLLVLTQFAILIGLILATATIYRQTAFGLQQGLRFDQDQLITITVPFAECEKSSFRSAIAALPGVRGTACSEFFVNNYGTAQYLAPNGGEVSLQSTWVGAGLFELIGLKPVAGRFFEADRQADALPAPRMQNKDTAYHVVINETAARQLDFASPAAAIGQIFSLKSGDRREIIGVVPDFSHDTVRQPIEAFFFENPAGWFSQLNVKLRGNAVPETLAQIDKLWDTQAGQPRPINRRFYDQYTQDLYRSLVRQSALFAGFSVIALFLAVLGLLGLATFTAERRTQEIGIRKSMGAGTHELMRLLVWQFIKPVLWASLMAWPIAGLVMNRWLHGFAYHIDLELWTFIAAAGVALVIALLTVSTHCYLVARAKPVLALRYE
ncbi:MAG: ABC transporter permease [Steroidobacteraceae bacterium]